MSFAKRPPPVCCETGASREMPRDLAAKATAWGNRDENVGSESDCVTALLRATYADIRFEQPLVTGRSLPDARRHQTTDVAGIDSDKCLYNISQVKLCIQTYY